MIDDVTVQFPHLNAAPSLQPLAGDDERAVRARAEDQLADLAHVGRELCGLLGMTSAWGASRWVAGPTRDLLIPTYRITVQGDAPDEATTTRIVRRLTLQGWHGEVSAYAPELRLDASRASVSMRLVAAQRRVRLTVTGQPLRLHRELVKSMLAGVYEDDARASKGRDIPGAPV